MPKIVAIVEGQGEKNALPNLLTRILHAQQCYDIFPDTDMLNANGVGNLTVETGIEKFVRSAATRRDCGAILILVDADKGCALNRPRDFSRRIQILGVARPVVIVAARRNYENWILASFETMQGQCFDDGTRLPEILTVPQDIESCNGKAAIKEWFPESRSYSEPEDQVAFTRWIDLELVRDRSRSFRRLWHAVEEVIDAIRTNVVIVTPRKSEVI